MALAAGLTRGRGAGFFGKSTYLRGCGGHTDVSPGSSPGMIARDGVWSVDSVRGFGKIGRGGAAGADREETMKIGNRLPVLAAAVLLVGMLVSPRAQWRREAAAVPIGAKDISGVVSSPQGREAGAWVIAETTELPTQFRRIVVTDDQGRYLVPDLPQADYGVWVRGYGLVDSPKMR